MQIVLLKDNLHEVSNPIFREKLKKYQNLSSAESTHSMLSVKNTFVVVSVKLFTCYANQKKEVIYRCSQVIRGIPVISEYLMQLLLGKKQSHYENTPIQIYGKFHLQKLKIFR